MQNKQVKTAALKFIQRKMQYLLDIRHGRAYNMRALNDIFDRLFGIKLASKLIGAKSTSEFARVVENFGIQDLLITLNDETSFRVILDLCSLYNEIVENREAITKMQKNNREVDGDLKQETKELEKIYRKGISKLRERLGADELGKGSISRYRSLSSFIGKESKKKEQSESFMIRDYEDDDEDEDDYDDYYDYGNYRGYGKASKKQKAVKPLSQNSMFLGEFGDIMAEMYSKSPKKNEEDDEEEKEVKKEKKKEKKEKDAMLETLVQQVQLLQQMVVNNQPCNTSTTASSTDATTLALINQMNMMRQEMNEMKATRQNAADLLNEMRAKKQQASFQNVPSSNPRPSSNGSGLGLSVEELDDDSDDDDEYDYDSNSNAPHWAKMVDAGCRDYNVLLPMIRAYYEEKTSSYENDGRSAFYESERPIVENLVSAICMNDQRLINVYTTQYQEHFEQYKHLLADYDDELTVPDGITIEEFFDTLNLEADEEVSEDSSEENSEDKHFVDQYNEEHGQ